MKENWCVDEGMGWDLCLSAAAGLTGMLLLSITGAGPRGPRRGGVR